MEPTTAEFIFWTIFGIIIIAITLYGLTVNLYFDPKGDDPYRYCPQDEN